MTTTFRGNFAFRNMPDEIVESIKADLDGGKPIRMTIEVLPEALFDNRARPYIGSADSHIDLNFCTGELIELNGLKPDSA